MKSNPIATKEGQSLDEVYEALMSSPQENWDATLKTNIESVYFTIAAFIPLLGAAAKQGQGRGSVVITGSIAGIHWDFGFDHLSYQVSKAYVVLYPDLIDIRAVHHLTSVLAVFKALKAQNKTRFA